MRTIRGRLAVWYAIALAATILVFAAILYQVQRGEGLEELDGRLTIEADLVAARLAEAYNVRGQLVAPDQQTGLAALAPEVASLLEGLPGYVAVTDETQEVLWISPAARRLPYPSLVQLLGQAFRTTEGLRIGALSLGSGNEEVRYHARPIGEAGPQVAAVVVGEPTHPVELRSRHLLESVLLVMPLVVGLSVGIGYFLVGRTLAPVDRLVDEVKAISDGRSLHRRLAPLETEDELARLTETLNAMLARLERSFGTLRRFTADASHELKTPLTVLRAGIERSVTHPQTPADVLAVLDETLGEVNRMTEMVDALLMLARVDEGRAPLHLESLDLRELLAEAAETASLLGEQQGVDVEVAEPTHSIPLAADRGRLRQLLMNLLTNAIKYTKAGGRVAITCRSDGSVVRLEVADTGIGIAPGDLPHIFDRFWRADLARSRTSRRPGVGLGLAISKWIAEAHGGQIEAQSRAGKGTTFTVTLPLTTDDGGP